jgi:hypothetical protein
VAAADVSAAVCPMLRATARTVAATSERWADEAAAAAVGDRRVVARALARAALLASPTAVVAGAVHAVDGRVVHRVKAMLAPPPPRRLIPAWVLAMLVAATVATAWGVAQSADHLLDSAGVRAQGQTTVDLGQGRIGVFRVWPG